MVSKTLLPLPGFRFSAKTCFGGGGFRSNPKEARPFSPNTAIHVLLELASPRNTSATAVGAPTLRRHERALRQILVRQLSLGGGRLYRFVIHGARIHCVVRFKKREHFQSFLRALGGLYARRILGAERGKPSKQKTSPKSSLWAGRPFSRLLPKLKDDWNILKLLPKLRFKTGRQKKFSDRTISSVYKGPLAMHKELAHLELLIVQRIWMLS